MTLYVLCAVVPLLPAIAIFLLLWRWRGRNERRRVEGLEGELAAERAAHARDEAVHREAVQRARDEANEAANAAVKSAMRTLQSLAYMQASELEKLEAKHGDNPAVLQDLLEVDHKNSMIERRAAGIATLCGGFLGRRREAKFYDVVRSAVGRIAEYHRVELELASDSDLGIVGQAVEPLAVVLAELLGNATSFSQSQVHVSMEHVSKGITVSIEDGGVGMSPEKQGHAAGLLSAARPIGITDLGNPPQFGFPVIGMLQQRHGFSVSVDGHSRWGGVRALIFLPKELLTTISEQPVSSVPDPVQPGETLAAVPDVGPRRPEVPVITTSNGLPKRRRRSALPPEEGAAAVRPAVPRGKSAASAFGAFQRGGRSGGQGDNKQEGR